MEMQLGQLGLKSLDDGHSGVLVEVVHDQHLEWPRARSFDHAAERRHHVLALVVNGNDHAQGGRRSRIAQIRPASISSRTHGMTSSSISSRVVVAIKPRTLRALVTSGTRRCTSCS